MRRRTGPCQMRAETVTSPLAKDRVETEREACEIYGIDGGPHLQPLALDREQMRALGYRTVERQRLEVRAPVDAVNLARFGFGFDPVSRERACHGLGTHPARTRAPAHATIPEGSRVPPGGGLGDGARPS